MKSKPYLNDNVRNKLMILVQNTKLDSKEGITEKSIKDVITKELKLHDSEIPNFKLYKNTELNIGKKSGFDGAAIHFYDKKN